MSNVSAIGDAERQRRLQETLEADFEDLTGRLRALTGRTENPDESDRHTQDALAEKARVTLAEVTQALRRMAEGRYGVCEDCGDRIPWERLEVLPHARHCLPCRSGRR